METINFYILHFSILAIADFIWAFFVFFIILKILRQNELLFTKKFYLFLIISAFSSLAINRLFEYSMQDMPVVSDIWAKMEGIAKLGIISVPTIFLMYIYFFCSTRILKLKAKEALFLGLVLGAATAPWRMLI